MSERHPESYCHRCDGQNVAWFVDSPIWNSVMGYPDEAFDGIVCPPCFMELADGIAWDWIIEPWPPAPRIWHLVPRHIDARKLTIHHSDGRVFDWERSLWVEREESA